MKLVDLVNYFCDGKSFNDFCRDMSLDESSEVIEIYMKKPIGVNSELAFFEFEKKTNGEIEFISGGIAFYNLFDFYYFLETMHEFISHSSQKEDNQAFARKLFLYAVNDA